jgi:hypothetical protein
MAYNIFAMIRKLDAQPICGMDPQKVATIDIRWMKSLVVADEVICKFKVEEFNTICGCENGHEANGISGSNRSR